MIERQYRHAASQYLWELPAGKLEAGEDPLAGAQRELAEETGYSAKKWRQLVEYYASPGFLGESMRIFVAEGLIGGRRPSGRRRAHRVPPGAAFRRSADDREGRHPRRQDSDWSVVVRAAACTQPEKIGGTSAAQPLDISRHAKWGVSRHRFHFADILARFVVEKPFSNFSRLRHYRCGFPRHFRITQKRKAGACGSVQR